MSDFIPGQRWSSDAEPKLGLGTILSRDFRTVTVVFMASGETRIYAIASAPLSRVRFAVGDRITRHDGQPLVITAVAEQEGILSYTGRLDGGERATIDEGALDHRTQLNRPIDRLFAGQIDSDKWFTLRRETQGHAARLAHSDLYGLLGGRTSLIPHQLYIAHEVGSRYAPRVLLADEVGLGKTIEAGLILHQQLLTGRAGRILILLPESLQHQWLVEMVRRFNLRFSLFDEARCLAIEASNDGGNPFLSEQLVICDIELLVTRPERFAQALEGEWDLMVVDEAHHLEWHPEQPSSGYRCVEALAAKTRGVLLLTATPEQLGKDGHFARLRLLDPDRFPSLETFLTEEQGYRPIAEAVEQLLSGLPLDGAALATLAETLFEGDNRAHLEILSQESDSDASEAARQALLDHLLDRHGTGRVLFRNSRTTVKGFPGRRLLPTPLPLPDAYLPALAASQMLAEQLSPELAYQASAGEGAAPWCSLDPRVGWLLETLKRLRPAKLLLITATAGSALDLGEYLHRRHGIHAALFHEGMSIVERDRAAAYFADGEDGSQLLICSEIGSEGRNFQFAHHLVLFDLPLNPDLLEQRIGRLDRIGQSETIQIHLPYLEQSAQQLLFRWYHEGLNAFEQTSATGHAIFSELGEPLQVAIYGGDDDFERLLETARRRHTELTEALHQGRDRLLEANSCRPAIATALLAQADRELRVVELSAYLERLFDAYGVDSEPHTAASLLIRPSSESEGGFTALPEEGMTLTLDRAVALADEALQFVTWEHPLVSGTIEGILSGEQGNTAVTAIHHPGVAAGTLLLESTFMLECAADSTLQVERYLPVTRLRSVTDPTGRNFTALLSAEGIEAVQQPVDGDTAGRVIRAYGTELRQMVALNERQGQQQLPALIDEALGHADRSLGSEVDRLRALGRINRSVRDEEVRFLEGEYLAVTGALSAATLRLDAVRVVITT